MSDHDQNDQAAGPAHLHEIEELLEGDVWLDPAYEAYLLTLNRECGVSITLGSAHDPYGVSCIKDDKYHEDLQYRDMHVGYEPFGTNGSEDEDQRYFVWQGGGSCQGDPLPRNIVHMNVLWDEASYRKQVELIYEANPEPTNTCDHLWVAGGLTSDWICEHCRMRSNFDNEED